MSNKILCIIEGDVEEDKYLKSIRKCNLIPNNVEILPFRSEIYQLYTTIATDSEDCYIEDLFSILKNKYPNDPKLANYSRNDFAEIYLFFDYDAHAPNASNSKIAEMINFFDNETENGKLYISYPMVEANKDDPVSFPTTKVSLGNSYKKIVNSRCNNKLNHIVSWDIQVWKNQIEKNLNAANDLLKIKSSIYNYSNFNKKITQINIFNHQLKSNKEHNEINILGSFVFFICDYRGESFFQNRFELN